MNSFGVVIVTYNRLNKLKKALLCFEQQSLMPDYILVVDNASNKEEAEYLDEWSHKKSDLKKIVIHNKKNLGGSGGFYTGLKKAIELKADWIWVSDDDAFASSNVFEEASKYIQSYSNARENISAICGEVLNHGKIDINHRARLKSRLLSVQSSCVPVEEYGKKFFEFNVFTYVGVILNKEKLLQVGLTEKNFFIWCDDMEHSLRLSRVGKIICLPGIRVSHNERHQNGISWKYYYGIRNYGVTLKKSFGERYFYYYCLLEFLKSIIGQLFNIEPLKARIIRAAIHDAFSNNMGLNKLYKPGWKESKR